jgi:DNA-binding CsgD family transcriptional regulator
MQQLEPEDVQKLLQTIQQLYSFVDMETFLDQSSLAIDLLVPSDIYGPAFHSRQGDNISIAIAKFEDSVLEAQRSQLEEVAKAHFFEHPVAQNFPKALGGAYKISDFINQQQLYRLEGLYQQYLRVMGVQDQMTLFLTETQHLPGMPPQEMPSVCFGLHREQWNFSERDRLLLNLLRPHLVQAYQNARAFHKSQQKARQFQQSLEQLKVIVLDADLRVQLMSAETAQCLKTYFPGVSAAGQLPDFVTSWVRYQVDCLHSPLELPSSQLSLTIELPGRKLILRLSPDRAVGHYLLLLEEQESLSPKALAYLGLSDRETQVVLGLIKGWDNSAIARQLGMKSGTVRKHLENIYRKLQVQSRSEAVSKALHHTSGLELGKLI